MKNIKYTFLGLVDFLIIGVVVHFMKAGIEGFYFLMSINAYFYIVAINARTKQPKYKLPGNKHDS